jgi:hypothetical protein
LARKKTYTSRPKMKATLTKDDVDVVITTMEDALEDILQRYGEKKEMVYERIEKEIKEI